MKQKPLKKEALSSDKHEDEDEEKISTLEGQRTQSLIHSDEG